MGGAVAAAAPVMSIEAPADGVRAVRQDNPAQTGAEGRTKVAAAGSLDVAGGRRPDPAWAAPCAPQGARAAWRGGAAMNAMPVEHGREAAPRRAYRAAVVARVPVVRPT